MRQIRRKSAFSEEFISITLRGIERLGRNTAHQIVLLDLGGKRTAENAEILRRSTHCIILSSQVDEMDVWRDFAIAEGCEIVGILQSQLITHAVDSQTILDLTARSTLQLHTKPIQGTLVNVCREYGSDCYVEAIGWLAEALINQYFPNGK